MNQDIVSEQYNNWVIQKHETLCGKRVTFQEKNIYDKA